MAQQELQAQEQQRREASAQQAQEFQAGQGLQRDRLVAETAQQAQQHQAAMELQQTRMLMTNAMNQERLDATAETDKERLDMTGQRNADLADYRSGLLKSRSDALDAKTNAGDFVKVADKASGVTLNVPTENYQKYRKAMNDWEASAPPATIKVPGKMWGQNDAPNPALAAHTAAEPRISDFLGQSAASELKQPSAPALPNAPQGFASPPQGGPMQPLVASPTSAPDPLLQDNTISQKPTSSDVSYLASHPEAKAKFEARFGVGSADKYLP